ncbi:MAG: type I restriction endonuclease subunit R [Elusimicrobia bacterium CG_4_9_14_3_um_filter_62_55]|nr:MAG: deoxyribonuclease [Elusimicrobia bacterium CG22_combo_CG10-13_8_21_14_all_63_91]PJA18509.1 MAG: type I restriction endonuclease subunit R [Elusimicrobia bacterium CG_4_10_14_0_2_um_filter_63_34]PJB26692.1 MAG: type I restriction endonuclease subunit R [Elusimicrobia bacterium CG_4_9_14_3_um_filter_62_55]
MITPINNEDRLVQETFSDYLRDKLGWDSVYAYEKETFGPGGTLGRASAREAVLLRDLTQAVKTLNPDVPAKAQAEAIKTLTHPDFSRSLLQHNESFYRLIRNGVPVSWRNEQGEQKEDRVKVIDFRDKKNNRFLAVRELKLQGLRTPHYNRRADLVCFVNGLPLVFIELKAVYRNIREGFDNNLTDYMTDVVIPHAFHHNAFLIVSNGERARYGSVTSLWEHFAEWKRGDEKQKGDVDAKILLDGMLDKGRLLDIVENFVLFDESKPGGTRKIVARNHQVLGVNNAVASVLRQEDLKREFPPDKRLLHRMSKIKDKDGVDLPLIERAHPDLGRLGVFWHTQGSGKSYSMAFFAEKVRRLIPGNFTFVIMTDRDDLDSQLFRTFVGCKVADAHTPRAASGKDLQTVLKENHRFVFSLIHKFNIDLGLGDAYTQRDDVIVISDEAHRTQAGKLARNMRLALPNASFIGFTGTPLFKNDHLTRRIFGTYVSRYDFKRSEEDKSTVKLVYESRGEKLGIARKDLNDRMAEKIEQADLDPDQEALLENLLGKDYEVITADDRLDKIAADFVEHCSTRWQSGKSMFVCIDKITCGRMYQRIEPRWKAKIAELKDEVPEARVLVAKAPDEFERERAEKALALLQGRIAWMESTIIEIIISEGQNEVRDFRKWDFDIVPHRDRMKRGFELLGGKNMPVDDAFKEPEHPFRVAIVCAMWLTGFDVECLSTLYIDKPMKAHTLMQAIARANRVYPGKDCGIIVDYNGMLKSLREALAQYAIGDEEDGGGEGGGEGGIIAPIEERVKALLQGLEAAEAHLRKLGADPITMIGKIGFDKIALIRDAVNALYTSDKAKRRFEIMAREIFTRFKALLMEETVFQFAERHDNLEAIYKKLTERRDRADVTELLKELHRIVNEAIQTAGNGSDQANGLTVDLSKINFKKLRDEFAKKVRHKGIALQEMRDIVEKRLRIMLERNPLRMDYYRKYQEIIAEYNQGKDRATIEETFAKLMELAQTMDEEQQRTVEENLSDEELVIFDFLMREKPYLSDRSAEASLVKEGSDSNRRAGKPLKKTERERLKQASRDLFASLTKILATMERWTQNAQTQAEVKVFILDELYKSLPRPPFTEAETSKLADQVYDYAWQRSIHGGFARSSHHA